MKIYVIPTSYPNEKNPIANIFIQEQVKALNKLGHEIIVLNVIKKSTKKIFEKTKKSVEINKGKHATIYSLEMRTFFEEKYPKLHAYVFKKKMERLYNYAIQHDVYPDVLYAHFSLQAGYIAIDLSAQHKIPLMTLEHDSSLMSENISGTKMKMLNNTVEHSEVFSCVSEGLREAVIGHTNSDKKIDIIPNMIDDSFIYYPKKNTGNIVFFAFGNLNKRKRFELLIESFCMAYSIDDKNVSLRIGGEGELYQKLKDKITREGRENQILLLGKLNRAESLEEYKKCDCFVLPSASETFGLVYREAMAVGRPIITTNHGGFSDADWSENYGIMIDVDDKQSLIEALLSMEDSLAKYDQKYISTQCLKKHKHSIVGNQITEVLKNTIKLYNQNKERII